MSKIKMQSKNWKLVKLKNVIEFNPLVYLKKNSFAPFISMDAVDGSIRKPFIVKRKKYTGGGAKFKNNDVLFARITPCLENGKIAQVKDLEGGVGFGSGEFFVFRAKENITNPDFIYYLSKSEKICEPAKSSMAGASGRQRASKYVVENLEVNIPNLGLQKQIADILSTYDDLIENNNRRIEVLEEMAQRIYEEWFVKFRFPRLRQGSGRQAGQEKVKMVESGTDFGKIPEGWEVKNIFDISYFYFCKTKIEKFEGEKEYLATANINGNSIVKKGEVVNYKNKPSRAQIKPKLNSVWFARMKDTYKILAYRSINRGLAENQILSSGMAGFQSEEKYFGFLYSTIKSDYFYTQKNQYATGATQVSLSNEGLGKIKIILPTEDLIKQYSEVVNSFVDKIITLQKINQNLRETRDLLLPKLVSGEVEVE
jgi:type I restriction enzyme S subunit